MQIITLIFGGPFGGRFLLLSLLTLAIYWPGLNGWFVFDDIGNILDQPALHISHLGWQELRDAAASGAAGPLKRPLAMASFAVNHALTGLDPWWFKLTNVCIHIFNGLLVLWIAWLTAGHLFPSLPERERRRFALIASALWLLHPLNLSPVLYVVQRMASLAALFVFLGIGFYLYGRRAQGGRRWLWIAAAFACTVPAALSKENGLLLPGFLFLVEWLVCGFKAQADERQALLAVHSLLFWLPVLATLFYTALHPGWITNGYANRPFDLEQRLMTESRVLWFYIGLFLLPNIQHMGLFHEDIPLSNGPLDPPTTLLAIMGLGVLVVMAWRLRHQHPIASLGIFWFLWGHSMESSVFPLELIHEHRNYLPLVGFCLMAADGLRLLSRKLSTTICTAVTGSILLGLMIATAARAALWGDTAAQMLVEVQNHPNSAATAYEAGRVMFRLAENVEGDEQEKYLQDALRLFHKAAERGNIGGLYARVVIKSSLLQDDVSKDLSELKRRLSEGPLHAHNFTLLPALAKCQQTGKCQLPAAEVWSLYEAIRRNPRLSSRNRALIEASAARFAVNALHDLPLGLTLARQAAEAYPGNGCARTTLIALQLALQERKNATVELNKAIAAGTSECSVQIRHLKEQLAAAPKALP
ncbi:protein O-mannosyl-transferase [Methylomarinovum caldicuralii]|uniref:Protein O-mannosyl-transferase n=1 Tax=Methylomarinovum caldicuralii TaxID=438856 RepID=A0AAU9CIT7_9GAMM|nr:hypothetical protein [Methylomarinovum caldicuralii]BCX82940.1 protein O-mannosyl-transferase [Methylomarinovum caldicuralii]